MIFLTTFMSAIIALVYYALITSLTFESKLAELFISLVLLGFCLGVIIVKYSRYKYEHISNWKYAGAIVVWGILALSIPEYYELWSASTTNWEIGYSLWMGFLWLTIFILPIWDITYSEEKQKAHV